MYKYRSSYFWISVLPDADVPMLFRPPISLPFSLYIHSVFMPVGNKALGSIHAGGGVTGNSWQLFKYLLSVSSFSLHLDFGLGWKGEKGEEREEGEGG